MVKIQSIYSLLKTILNTENRTHKALNNIARSSIYKGISIVISIGYVPLLFDYLGQEEFGIWLTLSSIIGWFSFFDVGLGNGLRNKLTIALANNDLIKAKKYVSTAYALLSIIFLSLILIFNVINLYIPWAKILNTELFSDQYFFWLTTVVCTVFFFRFILQLISVIYFSHQEPAKVDLINMLGQLLAFIAIYYMAKTDVNSDLFAISSLLTIVPVIVLFIFSLIAFTGRHAKIAPSIRSIDFTYRAELLNLGLKFFFIQMSSVIIYSTTNFFITRYYGAEEVAIYNISFKYFQLPVMVQTILLSPLWSALTDGYAKGDYVWINKTMSRLKMVSIIFVVIIGLMLLVSDYVYSVWLNSRVNIPLSLSVSLAVWTSIRIIYTPYSVFVNATGKIRLSVLMTFGEILIYFLGVYYFGNLFNDATGIVLASVCTVAARLLLPYQVKLISQQRAWGVWDR